MSLDQASQGFSADLGRGIPKGVQGLSMLRRITFTIRSHGEFHDEILLLAMWYVSGNV